jgi:hypothetical protein
MRLCKYADSIHGMALDSGTIIVNMMLTPTFPGCGSHTAHAGHFPENAIVGETPRVKDAHERRRHLQVILDKVQVHPTGISLIESARTL